MYKNASFLNKLAQFTVTEFSHNLSEIKIVLPNKRAKVFLLNELRNSKENTTFAPTIVSIEEFIQEISDIRLIDSVELIFEFYEVYLSLTKKENQQNFDTFSTWAKTALQDFNEIDRYLIDPTKVFQYLSEIKALERWNLEPTEKTELIEKNLEFWHKLPQYYSALYAHLLKHKTGYQGLIYKEAAQNLNTYSKNNSQPTIFAGFNALNDAEEKIMLHFLAENKGYVFWDIDGYFLTNRHHDVGLFIRRYKQNWKNYNTGNFNWVTEDFQQPKNIQIIGTPKSVGQAKIASEIIANLIEKGENSSEIALVLGDENLLIPALNALPKSVPSLNITMGYPSRNNPTQILVSALLKLHSNASKRSANRYVYYYKDVTAVLNHPLIEPFANFEQLLQKIRNENYTFFGFETLQKILGNENNDSLFYLLFEPWDFSPIEIINRIKQILTSTKYSLQNSEEDQSVSLSFLYAVYKNWNQIQSYQEKYNKITTIEELQILYKQLVELTEVSFEGEPLQGLQIMGVLESRVLDFKNIVITSVNEGKFPASKSQNSFIPYDIKKELGLPTFKEKDAIYSYHFYHLLFRAQNVFLLYNTDNEGIDAGEKSRFLQQLEIENLPQHNLTTTIYNAKLPEKAYEKIAIPKTEKLMERLMEIATVRGFSPSSLTTYIRNPFQFYKQRVLHVNEVEEVEEDIAVNTLGTIIHDTLEQLYMPFLNTTLTAENIDFLFTKVDVEVERQFKKVYKEGNIKKGRNFLAYEVAKRNIVNFLEYEKKQLQNGDEVQVLSVEKKMECFINLEDFATPIKLVGKIDRIEIRNGIIRIIDYKTGKVEASHLKLKTFEGLTSEIENEKIIQLLCYVLMYENTTDSIPEAGIETGIISFKNLKAGFLPFKFQEEQLITKTILPNFITELKILINEILNPDIDFSEKTL